MPYISLLLLTSALSLVPAATTAPPALSEYRGITLGDAVPVVVERLQVAAADVKVVQERPTLVQELTWRPHRFISGTTVEPDALAEMILTFHAGRLARIAVTYDRDRTQGMTDADIHLAMGGVYGTSMLVAVPTQSVVSVSSGRQTIGHWEEAGTRMLLWREGYPRRLGLTITAIADDTAMQTAIADGALLRAADAPARELARRTAETAALQARDEKIRRANIAAFKP